MKFEILCLRIEFCERLADLTNLVSLGLAVFFWLEIQENGYTGMGEDTMAAFQPQLPTRRLEKVHHVSEAMAVILVRIKKRSLGFRRVGHCHHVGTINYSVNNFEEIFIHCFKSKF